LDSLHPCDLTDPEGAAELVRSAALRFGGIDILVNAAAMAVFAPIEQMTFADWRYTLAGELDTVFLACKAAWPHLVAAAAARSSISRR